MGKLSMCRICVAENVRMHVVTDGNLHDVYEKLTNVPFITDDRRPLFACYLCYAKLKQCYRLMKQCVQAEEVFTRMLSEDQEENHFTQRQDEKYFSELTVAEMIHMSIGDIVCPIDSESIKQEECLGQELDMSEVMVGDGEQLKEECDDNVSASVVQSEDGKKSYQEYLSSIREEECSLDDEPLMLFKSEEEEVEDVCEEEQRAATEVNVFEKHFQEKNLDGQVTADEYYGNQVVSELKHFNIKLKSCEHKDKENKSDGRNEKIRILGMDMATPKRKRDHKETNSKENGELLAGDNRIRQTIAREVISMTGNSEDINSDKNTEKSLGKRTWNRRNACFYCKELVTNFTRHLLRHHCNEIEVLKYRSIHDEDPKIRKMKRQAITDKLRNLGNFIHNSKVSFDRDENSVFLPSRRSNIGVSSPWSYATCKICLGTFKRNTFFNHLKKCHNDGKILPSLKRRALYNHLT